MNVDQPFEPYRPLLFSIAYRMLGSAMEAEDMVQETFLRYQAISTEEVESPKAFLCTIVTRLCLNYLQSSRVQRETYVGSWLPEPLRTDDSSQDTALESISLAFLVLLESLTPLERAVFLLREVFDFEYAEIARIVSKDEPACRQLFSRAKKHIADRRLRFQATPEEHQRILERFIQAYSVGDLDGLMALLSEEVTLWTDGGGKTRGAAIHSVHGPEAVAQFVVASTRFVEGEARLDFAEVNGQLAVILRAGSKPIGLISIEVDQGRICAIRVIGNTDKLKWL